MHPDHGIHIPIPMYHVPIPMYHIPMFMYQKPTYQKHMNRQPWSQCFCRKNQVSYQWWNTWIRWRVSMKTPSDY